MSSPSARALVSGLAVILLVPPLTRARESSSYVKHLRELESDTIDVIEKCKPAFVFIGGGSGFCISKDGYVLTNEHVVREFIVPRVRRIDVFFTGGDSYRATVVGHDPQGDVALLKLENADDLPFLEFGDSSALRTGQRVIALGDPFLIGSANLEQDSLPVR